MDFRNAITIKFDDHPAVEIPVAFTMKFDIRQTLGCEPYIFHVPFHSDYLGRYQAAIAAIYAANKKHVAVTLRIATADVEGGDLSAEKFVEWKGWFAFKVIPDPELKDIYNLCLGDVREVYRQYKVSVKHNLRLSSEHEDTESLVSGTTPFTVEQYIDDVITRFQTLCGGFGGYAGSKNISATGTANLAKELPWNLGNTQRHSGGWVGGGFAEMLEIVEKAFGLFVLPGVDGLLYVTDKIAERTDIAALLTSAVEGSSYTSEDNGASAPKDVEIIFEVVSELAAENIPHGSYIPPTHGLSLENVMRMPKDITNPLSTDFEWVSLEEWAQNPLWASVVPPEFRTDPEKYICENFFKEDVIPQRLDPQTKLPLAGGELIEFLNDEISENWRSAYQLTVDAGSGTTFTQQKHVNIRIGRLLKDGGTKDGDMVFSDYAVIRRRGRATRVTASGQASIHGAKFSDWWYINETKFQPAKLRAFWSDQNRLLMKIVPDGINRLIAKSVIPGIMSKELEYGTYAELANEVDLALGDTPRRNFARTKIDGKLSTTLRLLVFINSSPLETAQRTHSETVTIFPGGMPTKVQLRAYGIQAVKTYSAGAVAAGMPGLSSTAPTIILNQADINEIRDRVAQEVKQSYLGGHLGAVKLGGIYRCGIEEAGGECNQFWVAVGYETNSSITSNWSIHANEIVISVTRRKLDGEPVKVAI